MNKQQFGEQQIGEQAFRLHKEIKDNEKMRRFLQVRNAELLSEMKDKKFYKAFLGDQEAEWSAYLSEIEVYYTRSYVYNIIRVYKKYVLELELDLEKFIDIPKSRLLDILKIVNKENSEDWFSKARTLSSRDWMLEIKGIDPDKCSHNYQNYEVCKNCGERHRL